MTKPTLHEPWREMSGNSAIPHKPFGELSDEDKGKLLLAHHEGKEIQRRVYDYPCSWYFTTDSNPKWMPVSIYRIAPEPLTPDSIDWSHVAPEYNFMARDCDGRGWLFKSKPLLKADMWDAPMENTFGVAGFASYRRGTVEWQDSLVIRPGYKGAD